ncbi:MAG: class I mannose-6-phosphate isomerase [Bacteroidales bacterium]|jgi:mannose-6-phosphate isomerase|nr:class I mannose-6-phosphate isomerase [Bacteroidales bacterium]
MTNLYPLKFKPILKERVWGGEVWQISGIEGDTSLVSNGFLKDNSINELVETYLGELTGDSIYESFGNTFPVLVKILQINDSLSLQLHPSDEISLERHDSYGKTECWYILEAKPTAKIYLGLNKELTPQEFYDHCKNETVEGIMNVITPKKGDFIYIEPGTLHAATGGITVAEIQQVSDVTYRVYDWGREHNPETAREMHLDLAIDCINFNKFEIKPPLYLYEGQNISRIENRATLADGLYFKVNLVEINQKEILESDNFNSFIIYFSIEGEAIIKGGNGEVSIMRGECAIIPANLGEYTIEKATPKCRLLEITGKPREELIS